GPTAVAAAAGTAASAAGTTVSVRVEGVTHALLTPTTVHTHSGSITTGGAPAGSCPATNAAGALDVATHHRWDGTYSSGLGIEVTQILGETDKYSKHGHYWEIFVNHKAASAGICGLTLHGGEQVLFAAVPAMGTVYPLTLSGPSKVTAGRAFTLRVSAYNANGVARPVSGVRVSGVSHASNAHGLITVTASHRGTAHFTASGTGYVRSAPLALTIG
nr:hypothetical protein [Actinomycetota bacterium]